MFHIAIGAPLSFASCRGNLFPASKAAVLASNEAMSEGGVFVRLGHAWRGRRVPIFFRSVLFWAGWTGLGVLIKGP